MNKSKLKSFIKKSMQDNYQVFGATKGDYKLTNAYLLSLGEELLTFEAFKAIASILRSRNQYLLNNPNHDDRNLKKSNPNQLDFLESLYPEDAKAIKKTFKYYKSNPNRVTQTNSRTKKSVRDVTLNQIETTKILYPILNSPKIKIK